METYSIISTIITIILGGGWFIHYRANKRKAFGEATQAEAEGWKAQQNVYQATIADLKESCDYIKQDRNLLREENTKLREENNALRDKINMLETQVFELKKEISRLGRRVEALSEKTNNKRRREDGND